MSPRRGSGSSTRLDQQVARLAVLADDGVGAGRRLVGAVGEERRVAGAVERGAGVVGHAAVDRDVGVSSRRDVLTEPTVYSVTPARAVSERPGSRITAGAGAPPARRRGRARRGARAVNSAIESSGSSGVAATPSPPPRSSVRSSQPSSVRARAAKAAIQSTVVRAAPRSRSWEPMWTWRPSVSGRAAQRLERVLRREPELRAVVAGADLLVGVGLDPGRDPDQRSRDAGGAGAVDLLERVDDDERAGGRRGARAPRRTCCCRGRRCSVAGDAGRLREPELAERRDVGADPLLGEDPHHARRSGTPSSRRRRLASGAASR